MGIVLGFLRLSKGFSREESEKILENGGKLSRAELLRFKVLLFSDGVVLGGKDFVNAFYKNMKNKAQAREDYQGQYEKRETGARKIRAMNKEDALYSMRDFKNY